MHANLIVGLALISAGGWLMHLGLHPPSEAARNYIPFVAGLISVTLLPLGFVFKKTLEYDYVVNGMLVIIGTITMTQFSIWHWPSPFSWFGLLRQTLFAEIVIAWTAFMLGKSLFDLEEARSMQARRRRGRFWRYPNLGWWWIHLATLSLAYTLGHVLWK